MKKLTLLLFIVLAAPMAAQIQTTTVTGTVTGYFNQPLPGHPYTIKEMRRGRLIIPMTDFTDYTDSLGKLSFNVPRSNFTTFDTTKIRIYINAPVYNVNGDRGVWLIVPDAPTAELSTLPHTVYLGPPGYAVLIPAMDDYGDSIRVADSLARVALALAALALTEADTAQMMAAANAIQITAAKDSARFANQRLDVAEASIIDVEARRDTTGKYERDRMDDLQQDISGKQSQLTVDQLARIDSLLAAGNGVTITSQGLIRVISVTESDPLAIKKDTLSLAVYGDLLYSRKGGHWTDAGTHIYRNGPLSIGSLALPDSVVMIGDATHKAGLRVNGGIRLSGDINMQPPVGASMGGRLILPSAAAFTPDYYAFGNDPNGIIFYYKTTPILTMSYNTSIYNSVSGTAGGYVTFGQTSMGYGGANCKTHTFSNRLVVKNASTTQYSGNFGGNVKIDSMLIAKEIKTSEIGWDTLGVQQGDTLKYYVVRSDAPITINDKSAAALWKNGSITFRIPYSSSWTNPPIVAIRGDSAAGVAPYLIEANGRGGALGGNDAYNGPHTLSRVAAGNWYRGYDAGDFFPSYKVPRFNVLAGSEGTAYYVVLAVTGTNDKHETANGTIEFTVFYTMPAGNTSSWYINLDEW